MRYLVTAYLNQSITLKTFSASINAINTIYRDASGELWFGTDADGVCKFNGMSFEEFTITD